MTLARTGNPVVLQAIRQAGRDLGEVVATCVNLLNPSVVVVGGSISRVGEQLLAGVREVVYQRSTPLATQHLTITQSKAGETGGVLGAAIMVIQHVLDPESRALHARPALAATASTRAPRRAITTSHRTVHTEGFVVSTRPTETGKPALRVGVVGLGWAGQQHMEAFAALDGVELVAHRRAWRTTRARSSARRYGVTRLHRDWKDLVAEGDLDVVSVAVPTFLHAPIAIGALEAGIHVLSEKPIARSATEAQAMVDAARAAGRVLEIAFNHRRRGDIEALKAAIDAGTDRPPVPRPRDLAAPRGHPGARQLVHEPRDGRRRPADRHRRARARLRAAPVRRAAGAPRCRPSPTPSSGRAASAALWPDKQQVGSAYEVEDLASVLLRLEGGGSLMIETSWAAYRPAGDEFGITIYGTEGGADLRVVDYAPVGELTIFTGDRTRRAKTSWSRPTPDAVTARSSRRSSSTSRDTEHWAELRRLARPRARAHHRRGLRIRRAPAPRSSSTRVRPDRTEPHRPRHRLEGRQTMSALSVTVWNEGVHETTQPEIAAIYPTGSTVRSPRGWPACSDGARIRTATLADPEHGLSEEVLADTDVLLWWGHIAHDQVDDEVVERVRGHVLGGMGLIVLHSGHFSKIFTRLLGTTCSLRWRNEAASASWSGRSTRRIRSPRASSSRS